MINDEALLNLHRGGPPCVGDVHALEHAPTAPPPPPTSNVAWKLLHLSETQH